MDVEISPTEDSNSGDSFGHLSELPSLLFFLYCILFPVPTHIRLLNWRVKNAPSVIKNIGFLILLLTFYCVIVLALAAFPQNKNLLLILLFSPGLGLFLYHQKYRNLSPRKPLAKVWADHKYAFITLTVVLFLMSVPFCLPQNK